MKFRFLCLASLALTSFSSCAKHVDYLQSYYYNQKYKYYVNKKEYEKAQTAELAAKENLQDHYELDSNLGIVFNLLNKNAEAEKAFDEALKIIPEQHQQPGVPQSEALFNTYYNRGVFFQSQSKVDEALKNYQAALDIYPTSLETKTNIELLIQQQQQEQKKNGEGKGQENKSDKEQKNKDNQGQGQQPDQQDQKQEDQKEGQDNKPDKKEKDGKSDRQQSSKYQPRPFKGDQLSEGDVKKILGELSQQDKKIRSQFNKKEKDESGPEGKNEKDW